MKNRDGSESNGYFNSSDRLDDWNIELNGCLGDDVARELGWHFYIYHRCRANVVTTYRKLRRWVKSRHVE